MSGLPIAFFILAAVAVATALGMLLSRNTLYSALLLVLNFTTVAVLYLILGAPFIALSQITVYAGSIMVLFLFVIMLLGAERLPERPTLRFQTLAAIPLALLLLVEFGVNIFRWGGQAAAITPAPEGYGSPKAVGELLFTHYMLPFEVTAVILLVAVVGSIMLAKPDRPSAAEVLRRQAAQRGQSAQPKQGEGD